MKNSMEYYVEVMGRSGYGTEDGGIGELIDVELRPKWFFFN